jgi:hypothetical protein
MKYSDLHSHNHSRAYFWLKPNQRHHERKDQYSPWTVISSNLRAEAKGKRAAAYSQSDLVKLWNGKVRLTFNALYPIERGFFTAGKTASKGKNRFFREIVRIATSQQLPLRDLIQMVYMKIPDALIDFIQSDQYDYWEWLQDEFKFISSDSGKRVSNKIFTPGLLRQIFESRDNRRSLYPDSYDAKGIYTIAKNRAELQQCLSREEITMVLTIEGMHAIGTDRVKLATCLARIDTMKKTWSAPIFFITFAHHFDNFLCGHARSLPDIGQWVMNQDSRRDGEFTDDGRKILRKLLSIDANGNRNPSDGYRILIDVKHMSAASRKQFYQEVVQPCASRGDIIPVIASHCGYSGIKTLDEQILACKNKKEKDDYFDPTGVYNAWNINMTDEDILMVFHSRGLFGLSFDQRILGVPKAQVNEGGRNTIDALWSNIKGVMQVIYDNTAIVDNEKVLAWDRISIGTDYEGYIDPINRYNTVLDFKLFSDELIKVIDRERTLPNPPSCLKHFSSLAAVENAVERLCFINAEQFTLANYPL